ncbi:MAG: hypothetical protein NZ899_09650 [Thermoguttaceae bacterium]|nr:hypothetical protein [Thermoguttaceae bacterium]MDW8077605.1 hypothetical protein [Thermoguttaceae bacterium]
MGMASVKSTTVFWLVGCAALLAGGGCSTVVSPVPVGEGPALLTPEEWDGEWYHPEGTVTLNVLDPHGGVLEAAFVQKDSQSGGRLRMQSVRVLITKAGDWFLCNFRPEDDPKRGYLWGRIRTEPKRILVWFPNAIKFANLVKKGILPGTVDDKGNVELGTLNPDHLKVIVGEAEGTLFVWDSPLVLFRRTGGQ